MSDTRRLEMSDAQDEDLLPELSTWHTWLTGKRLSGHGQIPKAALSHCYIIHTHIDAGLMWGRSHTAVVSTGQIRFNTPPPPISTLLLEFPSWSMVTLTPCVCVYAVILFHMCGQWGYWVWGRWHNQVCCNVWATGVIKEGLYSNLANMFGSNDFITVGRLTTEEGIFWHLKE